MTPILDSLWVGTGPRVCSTVCFRRRLYLPGRRVKLQNANGSRWHGTSNPGEPPAILESWGRQFYNSSFKAVQAWAAMMFNVYVRILAHLEITLQSFSGG